MFSSLVLALFLPGPTGPALRWEAPEGCPDGAYVRDRIEELAGSNQASAPMNAEAIVGTTPEGLTLTIDVRTPSGHSHKTVEAPDCRVLAEVTALMVATALDPAHVAEQLPPSDSSAVPMTPVLPQTLPQPTAPSPLPTIEGEPEDPVMVAEPDRPDPSRQIGGIIGASFSLGGGIVPAFDGRLAIGTGLRRANLRAEVIAFHVLAQRVRYPDLPTVGARVAAWGASARLGPLWRRGAIAVHVMADLAVAAVFAEGFGVDRPSQASDAWIALGLVPGLRWFPSPRLGVGLDLEGQVAVRRPAFVLDALPPLYRTARIAARGAVVVEIRLGHPEL